MTIKKSFVELKHELNQADRRYLLYELTNVVPTQKYSKNYNFGSKSLEKLNIKLCDYINNNFDVCAMSYMSYGAVCLEIFSYMFLEITYKDSSVHRMPVDVINDTIYPIHNYHRFINYFPSRPHNTTCVTLWYDLDPRKAFLLEVKDWLNVGLAKL